MRITLDTGILVRTNLKATGPARQLLEEILAGPHELVLSEFILDEIARVLHYPRLKKLYSLTTEDIAEHVESLRLRADVVSAVVYQPVVLTDSNDDPIVYTAVIGRADVLCTRDRDFYSAPVASFCRERGIEIVDDVVLLDRLRAWPPISPTHNR